jgi:hypothetical protein
MRKLKLGLDELEVASFEPGAGREERGTVQARELPPTAPYCSYVDACPTRLCGTSRC